MNTKWVRSTGVVWEELDGETVVVNPATGARWSLDAAATRIWKTCDGALGLRELAHDVAALSEITALCNALGRIGLLTQGGATEGTVCMSGLSVPGVRALGVGASGPRRRPSPRGNSGPG